MEKAKSNSYSTMTLEEAIELPFDGKLKDGKFTSLTLKKGLVKDDGTEYIERRIFMNADMASPVVYDLHLPLNIPLPKEWQEKWFTETEVLDDLWSSKRIATDAAKAGKGTGDPEVISRKAGAKLVASLRKMGQDQAADKIESALETVKAEVKGTKEPDEKERVKKSMKSHGFGK